MTAPITGDQVAAACLLSNHARQAILSARRSVTGAVLFDTSIPAAVRELRDNGLINSHYRLTELGARKHAQLTEGGQKRYSAVTFAKGVRCGGCGEILPDQEGIARDCVCIRIDAIECVCPDAFIDSGSWVDECPKHGDDAQANEAAAEERRPVYGQPDDNA